MIGAIQTSAGLTKNGGISGTSQSLQRFPAFIRRRDPKPKPPAAVELEIHRQPLALAADWQLDVIRECKRLVGPGRALADYLDRTGLLKRCVLLASDSPDGPLIFRYIGEPSIQTLGARWARENLGKPHIDNPHRSLPDCLGNEYAEVIESGEPLHNLGIAHGLRQTPVRFTHILYGWRAPNGRRAVLSCVQL